MNAAATLAALILAANAIGAVLLEGSWPEAIAWALAALLIIPVVRRLAA
ncbi:MAG: hypothetical protein WC972_05060 [Trueperaceae bacterium]